MSAKVQSKEQIPEGIHSVGKRIGALGVQRMGLFGSFATGRQTDASDIDLFVEFIPSQHTFDNFMELSFLLEDLFGRKVELVTSGSLSPYIGPRILQEVEIIPFAA